MIPVVIDAEAIQFLKEKNRKTLTIDVHKSGGG